MVLGVNGGHKEKRVLVRWVKFNDCRGWKKCEKVRKNAKNFEILQKMYAILRK